MSETPWKLSIECSDGRSLVVEAPDLITIRDVMRELAKAPDSERAILPNDCKTTAVFGDCFKVKVDGETVADGNDGILPPGWKSGPSLREQRFAASARAFDHANRKAEAIATLAPAEFTPHPFTKRPCNHPVCDCAYWLSVYSCKGSEFVTRCRARDIMVYQATGEPE
jgi:hypothetical protein